MCIRDSGWSLLLIGGGPQGLWSAAVAGVRAKSPVLDGADVGTSQGHSPSWLPPPAGVLSTRARVRCDPTRDGHLVASPGRGALPAALDHPLTPSDQVLVEVARLVTKRHGVVLELRAQLGGLLG